MREKLRRYFAKPWRAPQFAKGLILGATVGLVGLAAAATPVARDLEERLGLDGLFRVRGPRTPPAEVVVVSIDRESADHFRLPNEPHKWPRALHARLVDRLHAAGAAVIVFDVLFKDERDPKDNRLLAAAIGRAGNVVLVEFLRKEALPNGGHGGAIVERRIPPIAVLANSARALAPFPLPKVPVKVSQFWSFKPGAGDAPTLPAVALQIYALGAHAEFARALATVSPADAATLPDQTALLRPGAVASLAQTLRARLHAAPRVGDALLVAVADHAAHPDTRLIRALVQMYRGEDSYYLNFYGPARTIATVPYHRVIDNPTETRPQLAGKAVFVGFAEHLQPEQKDSFYTAFSNDEGVDISGVEIAATAFANLLERMPVRPLAAPAHTVVLLLFGMVVGFVCILLPNRAAVPAVAGLGFGYAALVQYEFTALARWYPLVVPLLWQTPLALFGAMGWKYLDSKRERRNIHKAFGYYLPANVVDELARDVGGVHTHGQLLYGACVATDAERYTALAERLAPDALATLLNRYYDAVFRPVKEHGGNISDVVGDAMLAVWASAKPDVMLRRRACLAALDIVQAVERFNAANAAQLPTRVGVAAGEVLLGSIGAIDHYEYRAVGDMVNTAARLESLNKQLGTRLLACNHTLEGLDDFQTRELGTFVLRGKSTPLVVYELLAPPNAANPTMQRLCTLFAHALATYRRQEWDKAVDLFKETLKEFGDDGPSAFYLQRCESFRAHPPTGPWSADIALDVK